MKRAVVWAVWILAGIIFSGGIAAFLSIPATSDYQDCRAEAAAESQHENFKDKTAAFFVCSAKVIESRDKLIVALGTGAIALFTLVLGVATVYLWHAGERQIEQTRKSSETQLRAYIHVVDKELSNVRAGEKPHVELVLRNCGQTPALNVRTWCRLYFLDLPIRPPLPFLFQTFGEGSRTILPPGGEVHIGADNIRELTEMDAIALGWFQMKRFWINGRVLYDDVFGNSCWTTFRLHSLRGPYYDDGYKMELRWSREGNRTEQSRPSHEENNAQETPAA